MMLPHTGRCDDTQCLYGSRPPVPRLPKSSTGRLQEHSAVHAAVPVLSICLAAVGLPIFLVIKSPMMPSQLDATYTFVLENNLQRHWSDLRKPGAGERQAGGGGMMGGWVPSPAQTGTNIGTLTLVGHNPLKVLCRQLR